MPGPQARISSWPTPALLEAGMKWDTESADLGRPDISIKDHAPVTLNNRNMSCYLTTSLYMEQNPPSPGFLLLQTPIFPPGPLTLYTEILAVHMSS